MSKLIPIILFFLLSSTFLTHSTPTSSPCRKVGVSIQNSTSNAQSLRTVIVNSLHGSPPLSFLTRRALEDCNHLLDLNLELLVKTYRLVINTSSGFLNQDEAAEAQTMLTAVMTYMGTCYDAVHEIASPSVHLLIMITENYRLSGTTLSLLRERCVSKQPNVKQAHLAPKNLFHNGKLNIKVLKNHSKFGSTRVDAVLASDVVNVGHVKSHFTTIREAIDAAPSDSNGTHFYVIIIEGIYAEYVTIPSTKPYIMLIGSGINRTVITGNRNNADGWSILTSPTFAVEGNGFVAVDITFRNTAGPSKGQAVAVRNGADSSVFYRCSFEGYQDTLFVHAQRQLYKQCDIYGTVDYIFGNAASLFQDCNIYSRLPLHGQYNAITAQGRVDLQHNTGISVQNCSIRASADLSSKIKTVESYLGRPWKRYATTVFMQSFIDKLISPLGWHTMDGHSSLRALYFAEYNNSGMGANTKRRVQWSGLHIFNFSGAIMGFTVSKFIGGDSWLPRTGVPYYGGLA